MKKQLSMTSASQSFPLMFTLLLLLQLAFLAVAGVKSVGEEYFPFFTIVSVISIGLLFYTIKQGIPSELAVSVSTLLSAGGLIHTILSHSLSGYENSSTGFLLHILIGITAFSLTSYLLSKNHPLIAYCKTRRSVWILVLLGLILYLFCFFSTAIGGARNWFFIGSLSVQLTEISKFIYLWVMGVILNDEEFEKNPLPLSVIYLLNALCLIVLSELGFLILITLVTGAMLLYRVNNWHDFVKSLFNFHHRKAVAVFAIIGAVICSVLCFVAWDKLSFIFDETLQKVSDRIMIFLYPESDPYNLGYQYLMAEQALFNGGLVGNISGVHTLVPVAESDMIFVMLVENLGFLSSSLLLGFYLILALSGSRFAFSKNDHISLVMVLSVWIQAIYNCGSSATIMPLSGMTLPLVSAGGTSILVTFMMLAIIFQPTHTVLPHTVEEKL